MADYWKSNEKHYCDFCKCWTAKNKSSIDFHERGKNHQANVKKKLGEIKKNQIAKREKDEASKKIFEQMEKAALAAVQKDLNSGNESLGRSDMKNIAEAHEDPNKKSTDSTYPWKALIAPQGFTYYYNSLTGESTWQIPQVFKELKQKEMKQETDNENEATLKLNEKIGQNNKASKDPYRKEQIAIKEEDEKRHVHPLLGGWSTVLQEEDDDEDLDETSKLRATAATEYLDQSENNAEDEARKLGKKFKEKVMKVSILAADGEAESFKKRKSVKRNVRRRDDDD